MKPIALIVFAAVFGGGMFAAGRATADQHSPVPPYARWTEDDREPNPEQPTPASAGVFIPAVHHDSSERVPVYDSQEELTRVLEENSELKARIKALEDLPVGAARVALELGIDEQDMRRRLNRSQLMPDLAAVTQVYRAVGAQKLWEATQLELELAQKMFHFRAKNPVQPGFENDWHWNAWRPFIEPELDQMLRRLYTMGLPPVIVEAFRKTHTEGW